MAKSIIDIIHDRYYDRKNEVAFECDCCGQEIYVGYDYYETPNGDRFCDECITRKEAE